MSGLVKKYPLRWKGAIPQLLARPREAGEQAGAFAVLLSACVYLAEAIAGKQGTLPFTYHRWIRGMGCNRDCAVVSSSSRRFPVVQVQLLNTRQVVLRGQWATIGISNETALINSAEPRNVTKRGRVGGELALVTGDNR